MSIKTPTAHAVSAILYVILVVGIINRLASIGHDKPDTIFIPVFMLSLFVLSAAIMGFLFMYRPLSLFLDGKKKEAVEFFWKTVGIFSGFVVLALLALTYSILR